MRRSASESEKIAKASERMKNLGMSDTVISEFQKGIICESLENGFDVCPVRDCELEHIHRFEAVNNAKVYHVVETWTPYTGFMKSYMYVSDYPERWEEEDRELADGMVLAYVRSPAYSQHSEFGLIGIEPGPDGSLIRIW